MKWFKRKSNQQEPTLTLEQQQSQKLAELGAQLWTARQEQGLSLEEMVSLTKIPRRLLQAMEEGNLKDLPEPVYIQGLLRQFADALGLNGAEFSRTFPTAARPVVTTPTPNVAPMRSIGLLRPIHLYLLYIFVIVCSVSSLSQVLNNAAFSANSGESKPQPQTVLQPEPAPEKPANVRSVSDTLGDNKTQSVQIGVTLKEASWIRVVADGKTEFEGILPEGTHRVWKAQEQLTVKTDNAGSVMMSVNQQAARQMGEPGKPEEVKIAVAKPQS